MFDLDSLVKWGVPLVGTLVVAAAIMWGVQSVIPGGPNTRLVKQLTGVFLGLMTLVALIFTMPFDIKGEMLQFLGIVVMAVIALSSTTWVGNSMAGLMLIVLGRFHIGDFIRVDDHFGRVTERGLLHTEIQSEDRDLVTLPNLLLITRPVRVVRKSGTLISSEVSLGYDVHRARASDALKTAAIDAELDDPFVQILELGDHAVTYKISGFLKDVGNLVTKRTQLRGKMLDALHEAGIEITSPTVMNQRPLPAHSLLMPKRHMPAHDAEDVETLMFDKAELMERIEKFQAQRKSLEDELQALEGKDAPETEAEAEAEKRLLKREIAYLDSIITMLKSDAE